MDLIDKKLYDLGFTTQYEGITTVGYRREIFDENGKTTDTSHLVGIHIVNNTIYIESSIIGNSCKNGRRCTFPLYFGEFKWLYRKTRALYVKWKVKNWWIQVKRRLFGHG